MQCALMLAINSVGIFLCFVTRHTVAMIGAFVAFLYVPPIVFAMLDQGDAKRPPHSQISVALVVKKTSMQQKSK